MNESIKQRTFKTSLNIEIEELTIASESLPEVNTEELVSRYGKDVQAISNMPLKQVEFGTHAFLGGMYRAYADHRPFTISPEMIWLLIQQGISMHLYHNSHCITEYYPQIHDKKDLVILREGSDFRKSDWREITSSFVEIMKESLDDEFIDQFQLKFSDSTIDEQVTGNLMIMDAMQPYFDYIVISLICGIPSVELQGSSDDWEIILHKLKYFRKFDLDWWFDKIEPMLEQIKDSVNGKVSTDFWMNMFKVHTKEDYGSPKVIDGWVTYFFPFDKRGRRILDKELRGLSVAKIFETLPNEIKTIPFKWKWVNLNGAIIKEHHMEFAAGFIGLSQDKTTMRLCPEIGWYVGHETEKSSLEKPKNSFGTILEFYSLDSFPMELLNGDTYFKLILNFKREINYPEEIADLKVQNLTLNGIVPDGMLEDLQDKFRHRSAEVSCNDDRDGLTIFFPTDHLKPKAIV